MLLRSRTKPQKTKTILVNRVPDLDLTQIGPERKDVDYDCRPRADSVLSRFKLASSLGGKERGKLPDCSSRPLAHKTGCRQMRIEIPTDQRDFLGRPMAHRSSVSPLSDGRTPPPQAREGHCTYSGGTESSDWSSNSSTPRIIEPPSPASISSSSSSSFLTFVSRPRRQDSFPRVHHLEPQQPVQGNNSPAGRRENVKAGAGEQGGSVRRMVPQSLEGRAVSPALQPPMDPADVAAYRLAKSCQQTSAGSGVRRPSSPGGPLLAAGTYMPSNLCQSAPATPGSRAALPQLRRSFQRRDPGVGGTATQSMAKDQVLQRSRTGIEGKAIPGVDMESNRTSEENGGLNRSSEKMVELVDRLSLRASVEGTREAAKELRLLLREKDHVASLAAVEGGIEAVTATLDCSDAITTEHAVTCVLNISLVPKMSERLMAAGTLQRLPLVLHLESVGARANAAATLFSLLQSDDERREAAESGTIEALVLLAQQRSGLQAASDKSGNLSTCSARRDALLALYNLSQSVDVRPVLVHHGAVELCVKLILDGDEEVEEEAAALLASLAKARIGQERMTASGAVAAMVELIEGGSPLSKDYAAHALHSLAFGGERGLECVRDGVPAPLLGLLEETGSKKVQKKATQILAILGAGA